MGKNKTAPQPFTAVKRELLAMLCKLGEKRPLLRLLHTRKAMEER